MTVAPQSRYPYAGIPWRSTTFGGDGLTTALQLLWKAPHVARDVLLWRTGSAGPMLLCLYSERTGDMATLAELWPAAEAALAWIDGAAS